MIKNLILNGKSKKPILSKKDKNLKEYIFMKTILISGGKGKFAKFIL